MSSLEFETMQKRLERKQALLQVVFLINSQHDLDDILQTSVNAITGQLGYKSIALLLKDEENSERLSIRAETGRYSKHSSDYVSEVFKRSESPSLNGKVSIHPDNSSESDDVQVDIPLHFAEEFLGLARVKTESILSKEEILDLEEIASHLALAISKAKRYETERKHSEKLELIARVGQRITSRLELEELFATTLEELHHHLAYDHVALFLTDPNDPDVLVLKATESLWPRSKDQPYRQSIHEGVIGLAAQKRQPILVEDVSESEAYIAPLSGPAMLSELSVPLLLQERLLGVLDLASTKVFSSEDLRAVQIVADQLAVAVDHALLFADIKKRLVETDLLYRISRKISTALSLKAITLAYLELVAAQGKYNCTVVIYEYDDSGSRKRLNVLGRWRLNEGFIQEHEIYPYFKDEFDAILDQGKPVLMANVLTDVRASKTLKKAQKDRPALAIIPLMVGAARIGLITLNHPKPLDWLEADLNAYQVSASQLATAIFSRQQQEKVLQHEQLLAAIHERQRLARDLHDSVSQLIFSMTLIAQSIAPAMARSVAEGESRIARLLELAQKSRAELRALLTELRPSEDISKTLSDSMLLRKDGLALTLEHHLKRLPDTLKLEFLVTNFRAQSLALEEALFRIAQEAVNNVVKHANAQTLRVKLYADKKACYLNIKDNGAGFSPAEPKENHFGLVIMKERAEALGGSFEISSGKASGTEITVKIPLQKRR